MVAQQQALAERLSYVNSVDGAANKGDNYENAKTPDNLENGALRGGDAPIYTSPEVMALLFQYAMIGIVYGGIANMAYPVLTGYFALEGSVLNSANALMSLGWSCKVFYGMLTDCFPIFGYHRKPYIFGGWFMTTLMVLIVAIKPAGEWADVDENGTARNKDAFANGTVLALLCTVACFCYICAGVAQDALIVEYAQKEPDAIRGRLQSMMYAIRTIFISMMSAISGFCLSSTKFAGTFDWDIGVNGYFWIMAAPCCLNLLVICFFIKDNKRSAKVSLGAYFNQFWVLAQKRAVWQVMIFQFLFNLFTGYISSTAGPYVKLYWAEVTNLNSSIISILSNLIFAAVLIATGRYGTNWNWRWVLIITTVATNCIDAVVQFMTIFDIFRNEWFYLGVPLAEQLPIGVNFVVGTFVIVELAEQGNEGIMYGLLTTIANLPGVFGPMITNVINGQFNFSRALIKQDSEDVRKEVAYTYMIAYSATIIGCLWVFILPNQKAAVAEMKKTGGSYPRLAGLIFLVFWGILACSITGTMMSMFESTTCEVLAGGSGCGDEATYGWTAGIIVPVLAGLILAALKMKNL